MFSRLQDVWVFLSAVVRRLAALVTGGVVGLAALVYEHLHGRSIGPWPFLCGLCVFLVLASYKTWQEEHHHVERLKRDLAGGASLILYDGVLWSPLPIPNTTNTWVAGGPFCPHDRGVLQAVTITGARRRLKDSDLLGVTISHLYCPSCSAKFRLGAPEAGHMRSVEDSRQGALDMILKSKGAAAVGLTQAQLKRDLKLGRLPPEWLQ